MRHGLAEWQAYLSEQSLPILGQTKRQVQRLINQAQLSIVEYASPIMLDAGFTAQLFRQVNTQRVAAGREPLVTLDNVLSHFGQSAFQEILNKTSVFDELALDENNKQGYLRVMGQACHASLQAKDWGQQRNVMQPEEMQLAALLQSLPELMLWCYGESAMAEIEELCYVKKHSYEAAANEILGCGIRELGASLAATWNLPEMAIDGLSSQQDNFTLATGVALTAELARLVDVNWYGHKVDELIQRIAQYKSKTAGEIEHRIHINAVKMTDELKNNGYQVPARLLPQLADDDYEYPQFVLAKKITHEEDKAVLKQISTEKNKAAETIKPEVVNALKQAEKKSAASIENKVKAEQKQKPEISAALATSIKQFQQKVAQASPAHDLIEHAVDMALLCGVQRCSFLVKVPNKKLLVTKYSAQQSADMAMNKLQIPLDKPHVFSLLMEKARNLFLNDSNRSKYWNFIPGSVKSALAVDAFFAVSIFVNNHALGMMYADKFKDGLLQQEFVQFQGVCRLLSKGILQSTQNKKK